MYFCGIRAVIKSCLYINKTKHFMEKVVGKIDLIKSLHMVLLIPHIFYISKELSHIIVMTCVLIEVV